MIDQLFIIALAVIAGIVACGLMRKKNMWKFILLYWVALTAKNVYNVFK